MASAETKDFDYVVRDGVLGLVSGPKEEIAAQRFELVTNQGEWFLSPNFGYPWLVKDTGGNNIGLLGTVFNSGYVSSVLGERLTNSAGVISVDSIELDFSGETVTGKITEILRENSGLLNSNAYKTEVVQFSFGGD